MVNERTVTSARPGVSFLFRLIQDSKGILVSRSFNSHFGMELELVHNRSGPLIIKLDNLRLVIVYTLLPCSVWIYTVQAWFKLNVERIAINVISKLYTIVQTSTGHVFLLIPSISVNPVPASVVGVVQACVLDEYLLKFNTPFRIKPIRKLSSFNGCALEVRFRAEDIVFEYLFSCFEINEACKSCNLDRNKGYIITVFVIPHVFSSASPECSVDVEVIRLLRWNWS